MSAAAQSIEVGELPPVTGTLARFASGLAFEDIPPPWSSARSCSCST